MSFLALSASPVAKVPCLLSASVSGLGGDSDISNCLRLLWIVVLALELAGALSGVALSTGVSNIISDCCVCGQYSVCYLHVAYSRNIHTSSLHFVQFIACYLLYLQLAG